MTTNIHFLSDKYSSDATHELQYGTLKYKMIYKTIQKKKNAISLQCLSIQKNTAKKANSLQLITYS